MFRQDVEQVEGAAFILAIAVVVPKPALTSSAEKSSCRIERLDATASGIHGLEAVRMEVSVKATVQVTLLDKTSGGEVVIVAEGRGLNVLVLGDYLPGRVLECGDIISSGETGSAVIGILGLNTNGTIIRPNDRLLLRDGPVDIGYADVESITIM